MRTRSFPSFLLCLLFTQLAVVFAETVGYFVSTEGNRLQLTTRMVLTAESASSVSILSVWVLLKTKRWEWARLAHLLYLPYLLFALLPCFFLAPYNLIKLSMAVVGYVMIRTAARKFWVAM